MGLRIRGLGLQLLQAASLTVATAVHESTEGRRTTIKDDIYPPLEDDSQVEEKQQLAPHLSYNCHLGRPLKPRWYAVVVGLHTRIYQTQKEVDCIITTITQNHHKKFTRMDDARHWLQHKFQLNGNPPTSKHRQTIICLGVDHFTHDVFHCMCCGEEYCTNGLQSSPTMEAMHPTSCIVNKMVTFQFDCCVASFFCLCASSH